MSELLRSSRPFSWINTGLPFLAAALSVRLGSSPAVILGTVYFLGPYNLLLYGVNDLFDYESDRINPRKGGAVEGGLLSPSRASLLWLAIAVTNLPLLVALGWLGGPAVLLALVVTAAVALAYSAPPLRTKVVPALDSITSSLHFVLPAVCGLLIAGLPLGSFPWRILAAFFLWGVASQALGAIQDARFDRAAGIGSIATALGERPTAAAATGTYAAAVVLLAVGGGASLVAGLALVPYLALAASCLGRDSARQARRAWRGFLGLNLLVGFVLTQLLLRVWGIERFSPLDLLAWGAAGGVAVTLLTLVGNEFTMRRGIRAAATSATPAVSVVVPVRDEGATVRSCLEALLAQRYPGRLQLTVVDDASSDGTVEAARQTLGDRGSVLLADPKPGGWTGKCWAAERGFASSDGEVLMFVDADTRLFPGAVARAVAELAGQGGMVSFLTRYEMATPAECALVPAFCLIQLGWLPIALRSLSRRRESAYAFGPVMAITRSAYVKAGGHAAISHSEREDLDLGRRVSAVGEAVRFRAGVDLANTRHYRTLAEITQAWRRTYYAYSGNSLAVALAGMIGVVVVQLLPVVVPLIAWISGDRSALVGSLIALGMLLLLRLLMAHLERQPLITVLWHPVTWTVTLWLQGLSVADGLRGRQPTWRGRPLGTEMAAIQG